VKAVLIDTNIVLDVLLDRHPYAAASSAVWALIENRQAQGYLSSHAITTIHYLLRKEMGNAKAKRTIAQILQVFRVAPVDGTVIDEALSLTFADFEDAVAAAAARQAGCEAIVTRDPKGFKDSPVRAFAPEAILPLLNPPIR
jgi:predicted nucleic acid-binding protein